jgi:small subunit ribosomal protein S4
MRLDTICFTLGFAPTIVNARQLVNHGHITVNRKVVDIPSFQCRLNDIIGVKQKQTSKNLIQKNLANSIFYEVPSHLNFDKSKLEAKVTNYCNRDDLLLDLNELLVIEYYSRR